MFIVVLWDLPRHSYTAAYYGGQEAGQIAGFVLTVAAAAYGISEGVAMIGTNNFTAITSIASSSLVIGSASAGLAGDNKLSQDLGYASLGVATAGAVVASNDENNLSAGSTGEGKPATVTGKFTNGQTFTETFASPQDFIDWLNTLPSNSILELKYVGHGNGLELNFAQDDGSGLANFNGDLGTFDKDANFISDSQLIQQKFAPDATIRLCGCYTAEGGNAPVAAFKTLLPDARVFGYTGEAWPMPFGGTVPRFYGFPWIGPYASHYVEVK